MNGSSGGMGVDYAAYAGQYNDVGFGVGDMGLEMGYVMPAPHGNEMVGMGVVDAMWNVDGAQHAHA